MRKLKIIFLMVMHSALYAPSLPPEYGKTQFIIGASEAELRKHFESSSQAQPKPTTQPISYAHLDSKTSQAFFTPDDDVQALLLDLIAHEKKAIYMAAYMITDKEIAQELAKASKRIPVEIVTDASCLKSDSGQIEWLKKQGIPVHVYIGASKPSTSNIMHNKFVIFVKNKNNASFVWTGSFNFTYSARKHNQENVLLLSDAHLVDRYRQQFFVLKNRCINTSNDHKATRTVAHRVPKHGNKKHKERITTKMCAQNTGRAKIC